MPGDCSTLHTPCMHQANTCRNACNRDRLQHQMHAPDCSTASSHLSISTHKHKRVYLRQHLHIHTSTYVYIHTHLHIHTYVQMSCTCVGSAVEIVVIRVFICVSVDRLVGHCAINTQTHIDIVGDNMVCCVS